jgi:hypothetical protein
MTCPICKADYETIPETCACGTPLILDDETRHVFQVHAQIEKTRTTKGLIGFGFLLYLFGAPAVIMPFAAVSGAVSAKSVLEGIGTLLIGIAFSLVYGIPAYFVLKAFRKRLTRRRYYKMMAVQPPTFFPARAPGLSDKQYEQEIMRLKALAHQLDVEDAASGKVQTGVIEPLADSVRAQHVWIPGLPGFGKSTLMHWMAIQDVRDGKGITVIDPAGDLVGNALWGENGELQIPGLVDWIPYERINDTIYLDLKHPVPIDFFSYRDDDERDNLVGNIKDLFDRLGEMFGGQAGVRFGGIVRDIVYTLFEARENGCPTSFIDIYDFIKDIDRRKEILGVVSDRTRAQWDRFPNDEKVEPIISRLTPLAKNQRLRSIFGTPDAKLKISDVMDEKSILLVNIGGATEAGIILGTMMISQLLQAAMRRHELPKAKRVPHHVYIDEFQNFQVGSDMAKILTQCRKYNLCLTIANQYTAQLPSGTLSAVFGGTSTWFLFRLSPQDIPLFPKTLPSIAYQGVYEKRHPDADLPGYLDFLKDKDAKHVDVLVDLKPLPFDPKILATLQIGEAIHRKADGTAEKVKTHALGQKPVATFAQLIRERTMAQFAPQPGQEPPPTPELGNDDQPGPQEPRPHSGEPKQSKRAFSGS